MMGWADCLCNRCYALAGRQPTRRSGRL